MCWSVATQGTMCTDTCGRALSLCLIHDLHLVRVPSFLIVLIDERDLKVDIWDSKWRYEGLATSEWNANDTCVREVSVLQTIPA